MLAIPPPPPPLILHRSELVCVARYDSAQHHRHRAAAHAAAKGGGEGTATEAAVSPKAGGWRSKVTEPYKPLGVPLLAYKDLPAPFPTMASKYLHAPPSRRSTRQRDMLRDAAKREVDAMERERAEAHRLASRVGALNVRKRIDRDGDGMDWLRRFLKESEGRVEQVRSLSPHLLFGQDSSLLKDDQLDLLLPDRTAYPVQPTTSPYGRERTQADIAAPTRAQPPPPPIQMQKLRSSFSDTMDTTSPPPAVPPTAPVTYIPLRPLSARLHETRRAGERYTYPSPPRTSRPDIACRLRRNRRLVRRTPLLRQLVVASGVMAVVGQGKVRGWTSEGGRRSEQSTYLFGPAVDSAADARRHQDAPGYQIRTGEDQKPRPGEAIDGRAEELPIQLPSLWTYIDHLTPGWLEDQRVKYGERGVGSGGERETPGSTGAKKGRTETVERNPYRILDRKLQDLDRKFWKSRNMTHLVGWGGATVTHYGAFDEGDRERDKRGASFIDGSEADAESVHGHPADTAGVGGDDVPHSVPIMAILLDRDEMNDPIARIKSMLQDFSDTRQRFRHSLEQKLFAMESSRLPSCFRKSRYLSQQTHGADRRQQRSAGSELRGMRLKAELEYLQQHAGKGMCRQILWYMSLLSCLHPRKRELSPVCFWLIECIRRVVERGRLFTRAMFFELLSSIEDCEVTPMLCMLFARMTEGIPDLAPSALIDYFVKERGFRPSALDVELSKLKFEGGGQEQAAEEVKGTGEEDENAPNEEG
ncbi:unnamed protein product [Vitrella brassicaformis CCMP3155]|uniref:Uncharacterized protein n=2 Tax=Vitrella brassicaformis TaxID=1169539 RepID=A0A0G4F6F3_VITBC|nr:unnamed protein product [Vitrella brassicaformis CCMP3155]|eukprot:CEM07609.1 unnamed protein product [Vitrella brassicaformis CCMP3155]